MRNILLAAVMLAVAFMVYKAYTGEVLQRKTVAQAGGVVHGVVRSGQRVGQNTGKAFRAVDFGGR